MKQNKWISFFSLLLAMVMLASLCVTADAKQEKGRVVRVGYPIQWGLTEIDEDGNYRGYTYEYLQEIAQYTGWTYEFVQVPGDTDQSLGTLMDMLDKGEIDLMGGTLYSQALAETYNYSAFSYGTVDTVLQVLHDDPRDIVIDSQSNQKIRIAIIETSKMRRQELEEYCKLNLIEPEYILCKSGEEQLHALKSGRADALLNTSLNLIPGVRTIAKFSPKPFYFIMSKNNGQGLMQELNSAISSIEQADPYFSTTLYEKYFVPEYNEILLSDAESAYVGEGRTLRVGVVTNRPPYQFMDKKGFAGISVDFLQYIAENTGLQFELVPVTGTQQQEQLIESGALDMMAGITYDYQLAQTLGVAMTRPYLSTQYVLILNDAVNEQEMSGRRLAVVKNLGVQPGDAENLVYFDTIDECIRAVNRGEADATYVDASTAQYYINHPEYNQLKVISQIHDQWQLCFGVAKSQTRHLLSILNKAIASVPEDQMQAFVYDNTMYQQQITLWSFIQSHPAEVVAVVLAFLLCIVALLLIWMRQRVKANRKMALDLKKHLQIYSLVNDYFIEYDFQADTLMVTSPATDQEDSVKIHTYSCGDAGEDIVGGGILDYIRAHDQGVVEMEQRWLDGKNHWLRLAVKTVHDDEGNPAYTIGKVTMIDEEKREQELLIEQAQQDGLTGVLNARAVRLQVEQNLAELSGQESGALLLIDIDNFKSINDTFGHMRGDEILKKVAGLLARSFRSNDVVGRPGGDEFIVYMRNVRDLRDLQDKCGDLCGKVRKIKIASGRYATISLGAALACSGSDYVEVYERADKALYQAKEKGRDRYEIALPESVSEAAGPKEDAGGRGLES